MLELLVPTYRIHYILYSTVHDGIFLVDFFKHSEKCVEHAIFIVTFIVNLILKELAPISPEPSSS